MSLGDYKINGNEFYGSKTLGSDTPQQLLLSHMLDITLCHSVRWVVKILIRLTYCITSFDILRIYSFRMHLDFEN